MNKLKHTIPFLEMAARFNGKRGHAVISNDDCIVIRYLDESGFTRTIFISPGNNSIFIESAKGRGGCTLNESTYHTIQASNYENACNLAEFQATCLMSSLLLDPQQCHH